MFGRRPFLCLSLLSFCLYDMYMIKLNYPCSPPPDSGTAAAAAVYDTYHDHDHDHDRVMPCLPRTNHQMEGINECFLLEKELRGVVQKGMRGNFGAVEYLEEVRTVQ